MKSQILETLLGLSLLAASGLSACAPATPVPASPTAPQPATEFIPTGNPLFKGAGNQSTVPAPNALEPQATAPVLTTNQPGERTSREMTSDLSLPGLNVETEPIAQKAQADLANRLNRPVTDVAVQAVIGNQFSQQAFFCNQTSKERTSKEVPLETIQGYTVVLKVGDKSYQYHASANQTVFCGEVK